MKSIKERFMNLSVKQRAAIIAGVVIVLAAIVTAIIILLTPEKPEPKPAPTPAPTATPAPTPEPTPTPEPVKIPVDFAALQAENPHIYAWIQIPDTNVNYPILQHPEDNSYYLERNIDGSVGYPGCIYTELYNTKDFNDANTVIYGHNMKNGTMFQNLHKFENLEFFNAHRTMYIFTPTQILEYRIFSAYTTDNRHLLLTYDFNDPAIFTNYVRELTGERNALMQKGNWDMDLATNLNSANKIITLQTCTGKDATRLLVQAVLVNVSGEPDIIVPSTTVLTGTGITR